MITATEISAMVGVVLSLIFSYAPVLKDWYDKLTPTPKRLLMLALLALTALGSLLWTCRADLSACVGMSWEAYLSAFIGAAVANQAAYTLTPLSPARREVRKAAAEKNMNPPVENRTNQPLG